MGSTPSHDRSLTTGQGGSRRPPTRDRHASPVDVELALALEREELAREALRAAERALAAVNLRAGLVRLLADDGVAPEAAAIEDFARRGLTALRRATTTIDTLAPATLDLAATFERLGREYEATHCTDVRVVVDGAVEVVSGVGRRALLRAVQEALSNVERHAEAGNVTIEAGVEGDRAVVRVRDDGLGLAGPVTYGAGLELARAAVEAAGGRIGLRELARGVEFEASVPLR